MKKAVAALALSSALLMTGCAGTASAQPAASPSAAAASSPAAVTSSAPSQTAQATAAASSSSAAFSDSVAQGIKDKVAASAGDTSKYLPAVRATVKKGTDSELVGYGAEVCAATTTDGVNAVIAEMVSKGYSKDDAATVAISAGVFLCPKK